MTGQMKYLITLVFVLIAGITSAQDLSERWDSEVKFRQTGMLVLGSWAVTNIAGGLALRAGAEGSRRYFHEMNAIWNTVNLGIAAFGYFSAVKMGVPESAFDMYKEQVQLDKVLLFNAGLDLAYVATGFWLIERSRNTQNRPERLEGYGHSLIMQGAFLFAFDLVLFGLHQRWHLPADMVLSISPGAPDYVRFAYTF